MFIALAIIALVVVGSFISVKIVSVNNQDEDTEQEEIVDDNS